ncbi:motility-associated ABC transporter substrate-binding family protein [Halorussus marinus]|uniref:DUF4350 domain-containing protein n=1 Tax=Halorussus marinus TaxID=2505976 RepID=UPI00106E03C6|nr:DUF4350 domain-containing protein [Halorussus marinus]
MRRTELLKSVVAFALVAGVVLASVAGAGVLLGDATDASTDPDAPAFTSDSLPATPVADDGTVTAPEGDEPKTVVVDRSHANAVQKSDLQPLVDALIAQGHEVRFHTGAGAGQGLGGFSGGSGESTFNDTLRSADAFVVANPATEYTADEIAGIEAFAEAGGRVLLLADPAGAPASSSASSLPIPLGGASGSSATPGQPTNLAAAFDLSFDAGYLYDMAENANHFQSVYAAPTGDGPLATGADRVVLRDAAAIATGPDAEPVLAAADARLSSTRRAGNYTVAARAGNVTAIGDTDFLAPATATVGDNDRLVGNVAGFLVTGEKTAEAPAPAGGSSGVPELGPGGVTPPQTGNQTTNATSG